MDYVTGGWYFNAEHSIQYPASPSAYGPANSIILTGHSTQFTDDSNHEEEPVGDQGLTGGWLGGEVEEERDERRENEKGQLEKWCWFCETWINLGSSKGSDYAFRLHQGSRPCRKTAKQKAALAARRELQLVSVKPIPHPRPPLANLQPPSQTPPILEPETSVLPTTSIVQPNPAAIPSGHIRCPQCGKPIRSTSCRVHVGRHILRAQRAPNEGSHVENVSLPCFLSAYYASSRIL